MGLVLTSCQIDFSGLSSLLDSNATYLSLPGTRVADVLDTSSRYKPTIDGTDASGAFVLGIDRTGTEPRLSITPFDGGAPCFTTRADDFRTYPFGARSELPPFFPFRERTAQGSNLHFVDPKCQEPFATVEDAGYPVVPGWSFEPPGFLSVTADGELFFLEPWSKKRTSIATGASKVQYTNKKVWSVEGGSVVARDASLHVVGTFGTGVTELRVVANDAPRAAYIDGSKDLYVIDDALNSPKKIASDACNVSFPPGWNGRGVAYFEPCEAHRLVLFGTVSVPFDPSNEAVHVVGDSALGAPTVDFSTGKGVVFYVKNPDFTARNGELWAGHIDSPVEHIADNPSLVDSASKAPSISQHLGSFQFFATVDNTGQLLSWKPGAPAAQIAENVSRTLTLDDGTELAIANSVQGGGDLIRIQGTKASQPILTGVSDPGAVTYVDATLNTGRYFAAIESTHLVPNAGTSDSVALGNLMLSSNPNGPYDEVAKGVPDYDFISSLQAIGYLHDYDVEFGVGILGVRLADTGDTFDLGIQASYWHEVSWPAPGILYVAPLGRHPGVWFARLL